MQLNKNLAHIKNFIILNIFKYKINIALMSRDMSCDHLLESYIIDKINIIFDGLKKRNWVIRFFSFILKLISLTFLIWNNCPLDFNRKLWGKTSFSMPSFNLELFKNLNFELHVHNFIPNIESEVYLSWSMRKTNHYSSKQSKFATNLPISSIFNFWSHDMWHVTWP